MKNDTGSVPLPVRVYREVSVFSETSTRSFGDLLAKFRIYLPDRPGSLAGFASTIAHAGGNISFFHYDRSINSSRVAVEVQFRQEDHLKTLITMLRDNQYDFEQGRLLPDEVQVTAIENILEVKVRLSNQPGTLAAFARLLADHGANVIYMLYDEDIDPESSDIAMVTKDTGEIDRLMNAMNERGYYYRVLYRGADEQEAAHVIGLKMVEKFFLRLKKLLPTSGVDEIKSLVSSSRDLHQDLVNFYTEAGNNLEAGDVFEKVLTFASRSRSRTGKSFSAQEMQTLHFPDDLALFGFRLPTSENFYLFRHGDELTMIDTGHGIYYEDIKNLLRRKSLDPSRVRRILVTHPDTDHAGASGYFEEEFGTEVFMHPGSRDVMENMNRAYGVSGSLLSLNRYYTRLSSRFTECRFPAKITFFPVQALGMAGAFAIISSIPIGALKFEVLESHGGHTPGLVFFLNREFGLLFTSDFLLNVQSLSADEKEHLSLYRYLLTNPNSDNQVYRKEVAALKAFMLSLNESLKPSGRSSIIFPGHGSYYRIEEMSA